MNLEEQFVSILNSYDNNLSGENKMSDQAEILETEELNEVTQALENGTTLYKALIDIYDKKIFRRMMKAAATDRDEVRVEVLNVQRFRQIRRAEGCGRRVGQAEAGEARASAVGKENVAEELVVKDGDG